MAGRTHNLSSVLDEPAANPELASSPPSAARAVPSSLAGWVIGGKYRLISEIGRGGMGSVWRAEHLGWEAPVAVKLMNVEVTEHPEARARFEREVRLAAGLRSPHVVQVLDHGVEAVTGTPFIVMELLEGESLAQRLKRFGRLSPGETFSIINQLVRALSRAHEAGIVHRDLKPENVFLVRNEEESVVKILDFGVAKGAGPRLGDGLTRPGRVLGTPFYMSPEQLRGGDIDYRADLWGLSAIACECLTGRRPFEATDFAQLALMLLGNSGRPLPSTLGPVPAGFDTWFLRATHPEIERRFQSARELVQLLAPVCGVTASQPAVELSPTEALSGERERPSMAPVAHTASRRSPRWLWQMPVVRIGVPTLLTLGLVGGGLKIWYGRPPGEPAAPLAGPSAAPPPAAQTQALTPAPPAAAAPPVPPPIHVRPLPARATPELLPNRDSREDEDGSRESASSKDRPTADTKGRAVSRAPRRSSKARVQPPRRKPARTRDQASAARRPDNLTPSPASVERPARPEVDVNGRRIRMSLDPSP